MKKIGAHVSVSGGVEMAPVNALGIGADAFALFTKNQRQWIAKPLSVESVTLFKENCEKEGFDARYVLPHDSYLKKKYQKAEIVYVSPCPPAMSVL